MVDDSGSLRNVVKLALQNASCGVIEAVVGRGQQALRLSRPSGAALPRNTPGIVIVQHMPERFTATLAGRLNGRCAMAVRDARDSDRGLRAMRDAGAQTAAQDEASSGVFGMPREAIKLGAAAGVLALGQVSGRR